MRLGFDSWHLWLLREVESPFIQELFVLIFLISIDPLICAL